MSKNQEIYSKSSKRLPGGVCSSARVNKVLKAPLYIAEGNGSRIRDYDGNEYIDFCLSYGASLVGHRHPLVAENIQKAVEWGLLCSYDGEWQGILAEKVAQTIPCIDMLRFTITGTETTYYAIKLAREYTQRQKILKFEGHFHGFNDYLAFNYWPVRGQAWPVITPAVERLPKYDTEDVIVLPYNDFDKVKEAFAKQGSEIAALIIEPINYNSGTIMPKEGYLELLRELTSKHGTVLIFDEVLSGFRTGPDCAQGYFGVTPDLCTLGKAIGGGTPLSCFGGKKEIMEHISPLGKAQHSGTYNGHLIEIMAGNAFFDIISEKEFYPKLLRTSEKFYKELDAMFKRLDIQARIQHKGARFAFYFGPVCEKEINNYQDLMDNQWGLIDRFYGACLKHGVYFHTMMHHGLSSAHTDKDIDQALSGIESALKELKAEGLDTKEGEAAPF